LSLIFISLAYFMLAINIFAICKLVNWSNYNLVIFCQWYFFILLTYDTILYTVDA